MEYTMPQIQDIKPNTRIKTVLLVASAVQKQARNGMFWQLELKDATGSIEARIWFPLSQNYSEIATGTLAEIEANADQYREQTQLALTAFRPLEDDEYAGLDLSRFVASSRYTPAVMLAELEQLCREVLTYKPWRTFVSAALKDPSIREPLLRAPAARGVHHAWVGGLLEHTLGVCRLCMSFADLYPNLDRQVLLVGAIFHDIGKLREFSIGLNTEYTDEGKLLGHITLGVDMLMPYFRKAGVPEELKRHALHLILSHHGLREYGSPVLPQTAEALALHYADNMDAKMVQCRSLFDDGAENTWSSYQKTLERAIYLPPRTPEPPETAPKAAKNDKTEAQGDAMSKQELQQCSLV